MNDTDAAALANDIRETWTLAPSKRILIEALRPMLDTNAARRAYIKLRNNRPGRDIDIYTLRTAYRAERPDSDTHPEPTGCAHCTDGWNPTTYTTTDGRTYTGVTPCTCHDGRRHHKLHREILDARTARQHTEPTAPPPPNLHNDHTLFDTPDTDHEPEHDAEHEPQEQP